MGFPVKLLGADEHVVVHMRTHAKTLILPAIVLIVIAAATGIGEALLPAGIQPIGGLGIGALALIALIIWVLRPFLRWWTTTYTITNRRVITRRGILTKRGKDLPLMRINDVAYERSLSDRIFGCGTLNIQTASEAGMVVLRDVPDVERVHVTMTELLFGTNDHAPAVPDPDPYERPESSAD